MRPGPLFALSCLMAPLAFAEDPNSDPKKTPPPVERAEEVEIDDPKLKAEIDDCIRRGVNWLKEQQKVDGSWPGILPGPLYPGYNGPTYLLDRELSALSLLTLLKCGVPVTDPHVVKGFAWLEKQDFTVTGGYGSAIALLALEAKHAPKEALAKAGQKSNAKPKPVVLGGPDVKWATTLALQLTIIQHRAQGGWRYKTPPTDMAGGKPGNGDVSCTQYALMGLKTARRMGIPVKPEVFARAADFLLDQQEADGKAVSRVTLRTETDVEEDYGVKGYSDKVRGWPYMKGAADASETQASGGMTCAGLVGMLICRSELIEDQTLDKKEKAKRLSRMEQSIFDGLAWLDANWTVASNPPHPTREHGFYLYGLERAGIMADLRMIGPKHDWYLEGARFLTSHITKVEEDKGFWTLGAGRPKPEGQDTPYALLFLRKAAIRIGYPVGETE